MSSYMEGFLEVFWDGKWQLVLEPNLNLVEPSKILDKFLLDINMGGIAVDEEHLCLVSPNPVRWDQHVDGGYVRKALARFPERLPQFEGQGGHLLTLSQIQAFDWDRIVKWLVSFSQSDLARGDHYDMERGSRQPLDMADFILSSEADIPAIAHKDTRVEADIRREMTRGRFPILKRLPGLGRGESWYTPDPPVYDSHSYFLYYASSRTQLRYTRFLDELVPAMAQLVPQTDGHSADQVRMVFWYE